MRFADIVEEMVDRLAPNGAIIAGNSVGGFSAARLAIRRPDLVRGLVLIDSGGFLGRGPQVRAFCALMSRRPFLRSIYPAFSARYIGIATTRRDPGLTAVSELWHSFASAEHDLRRYAAQISAPTLLLWGRRDPVIPHRVGVSLEREIPGARLVGFDSGHVPHTTDPDGVAAELVAFADAVYARRAPRVA
jgi:pimeloyl-ACP methyl ester carboxylesterase